MRSPWRCRHGGRGVAAPGAPEVYDGGVVTEAPGVYLLGLTFLRRRKSSLIDGVGDDARDLSAHLARYLGAA
jgi:putative flavoprotein involved in K+ transport